MAKILYIEAHTEIRDTLAQLLELNRYEVAVAKDGIEGVEKAQTWSPDLILTNLRLPRMDGFEAIKVLRSQEKTVNTPIIVLSAWSSAQYKDRALAVGANKHITQPADLPKLLNTIDHYLQSWIYDRDYKSLKGANLETFSLHGVDLSGADLSEANLSRAVLVDANLSRANLNGANLSGADLRGTNLSQADLCGADLRNAIVNQPDLSQAGGDDASKTGSIWRRLWKLFKREAKESGSDEADQQGIAIKASDQKPTIFDKARYDHQTLWPENFDPEQAGANFVE